MPDRSAQFDVVIVGAGMVGLTLAALLAKQSKVLAVVDHRIPPPDFEPGQRYDARVTAISPGSKAIFEHVNAWPAIQSKRISPFQAMFVWDSEGEAKISFVCSDVNYSNIGYIVENTVIRSSLHEVLLGQEEVHWKTPMTVEKVLLRDDCIETTLNDGQVLQAKLLIGADGCRSDVRKLAGIPYSERRYRQHGIIARVQTEYPHQATAWQWFLNTGPLAFLPLCNNECSIVWSANDEYASKLMKCSDHEFGHALTEASNSNLGKVSLRSERTSFPLISGQAETMLRPRIALAGDAAHALHPLAGQGANLGFTDAAVLADVLANTRRDIGSYRILRKYERARAGETRIMQYTMDVFVMAFGSSSRPVITARNFALNTADRIQPMKRFFMRRAMGLNKDRPAFAR